MGRRALADAPKPLRRRRASGLVPSLGRETRPPTGRRTLTPTILVAVEPQRAKDPTTEARKFTEKRDVLPSVVAVALFPNFFAARKDSVAQASRG
jgi:hypothetical protein